MLRILVPAIVAALLLSGCDNTSQTNDAVPAEQPSAEQPPTEGHATALSEANFSESVDSAPVAMVDFWAPWCGPCVAFAPTVNSLAGEYEGRVLVCKLNVDDAKQTTSGFGIESIPTVIFFKNGQEVKRITGAASKAEVAGILDSLLE